LPQRRAAPDSPLVVESELAVERLLASRTRVHALLATPPCYARLRAQVGPGTAVYLASAALVREIVGFDMHRGCLAHAERPDTSPARLSAVVGRDSSLVVLCEQLTDPRNLGAVVRSARAFGAQAVVVSEHGADPFDRRAVRASMGHVFTLPVVVARPEEALAELRRLLGGAVQVLAATVGPRAIPVHEVSVASHLALLVGNEGQGLSASLVADADAEITVPIDPTADSLNVAAASAVLLYALTSRRMVRSEQGDSRS
jgi:tRNA G18 (ribose-2'-O)-methylase SpoU